MLLDTFAMLVTVLLNAGCDAKADVDVAGWDDDAAKEVKGDRLVVWLTIVDGILVTVEGVAVCILVEDETEVMAAVLLVEGMALLELVNGKAVLLLINDVKGPIAVLVLVGRIAAVLLELVDRRGVLLLVAATAVLVLVRTDVVVGTAVLVDME